MFCYESLFWTFLFPLKILYTTTKIYCHQNFKKIYLLLKIGIDVIISWPQKTWKKFSIKSIIKSRLTFFFRMTSGKAEHFLNWIFFFFLIFCYTYFLSMVKILQELRSAEPQCKHGNFIADSWIILCLSYHKKNIQELRLANLKLQSWY